MNDQMNRLADAIEAHGGLNFESLRRGEAWSVIVTKDGREIAAGEAVSLDDAFRLALDDLDRKTA